MINLSLTILTFKERYRIQSDIMNIRKICTGDIGDIGDIASFANIVMRFFYNNHVLIERRCLFAANLHSNVLPYEQGYLV